MEANTGSHHASLRQNEVRVEVSPNGSIGDQVSNPLRPAFTEKSGLVTSPNPTVASWHFNIDDFAKGRMDLANGSNFKKRTKSFYEKQNELIDSYVRIDQQRREHWTLQPAGPSAAGVAAAAADAPVTPAATSDESGAVRFAINTSFAGNICLFAIKIVAAVYSGSLAVIASAIDSSLDLVSGSIIYFASRMAARSNPTKYPIGKARLEPLAIIVFASMMGVASLQLMVTSIQDIVTGYMESQPTIRIDALTYGVLGCVIGVKTLLYGICSKLSDKSPSVDALAQDHRNDVATNTATIIAVALAMNFKYLWVLDPVCAFLLATLIVTNWAITGKEYIQQMTGKVAEPAILSQLTFIACNHHPAIKAVDTVRAYHVGSKVLAEVDIVLPSDMPLQQAHDIGESLQRVLESEDYIERAFVHMDFETEHAASDEHSYPWASAHAVSGAVSSSHGAAVHAAAANASAHASGTRVRATGSDTANHNDSHVSAAASMHAPADVH